MFLDFYSDAGKKEEASFLIDFYGKIIPNEWEVLTKHPNWLDVVSGTEMGEICEENKIEGTEEDVRKALINGLLRRMRSPIEEDQNFGMAIAAKILIAKITKNNERNYRQLELISNRNFSRNDNNGIENSKCFKRD